MVHPKFRAPHDVSRDVRRVFYDAIHRRRVRSARQSCVLHRPDGDRDHASLSSDGTPKNN